MPDQESQGGTVLTGGQKQNFDSIHSDSRQHVEVKAREYTELMKERERLLREQKEINDSQDYQSLVSLEKSKHLTVADQEILDRFRQRLQEIDKRVTEIGELTGVLWADPRVQERTGVQDFAEKENASKVAEEMREESEKTFAGWVEQYIREDVDRVAPMIEANKQAVMREFDETNKAWEQLRGRVDENLKGKEGHAIDSIRRLVREFNYHNVDGFLTDLRREQSGLGAFQFAPKRAINQIFENEQVVRNLERAGKARYPYDHLNTTVGYEGVFDPNPDVQGLMTKFFELVDRAWALQQKAQERTKGLGFTNLHENFWWKFEKRVEELWKQDAKSGRVRPVLLAYIRNTFRDKHLDRLSKPPGQRQEKAEKA